MTRDNIVPFNPLDKRHLGQSVGQAMLMNPAIPYSELQPFDGAGIYAIYYHGDFPAYKTIALRNRDGRCTAPIYVGKAVPKGSRKGGDLSADPGRVLFSRLAQHRRSIEEASNLEVSDFSVRFLVVDDIWIPLGEALLIARFVPIWNSLIDGFGNHDPGKGRLESVRSRWDALHPGRTWANQNRNRDESADEIARDAQTFLRQNPPPENNDLLRP